MAVCTPVLATIIFKKVLVCSKLLRSGKKASVRAPFDNNLKKILFFIFQVIIVISTSFVGAFAVITGFDYYLENSTALYYSVNMLHGKSVSLIEFDHTRHARCLDVTGFDCYLENRSRSPPFLYYSLAGKVVLFSLEVFQTPKLDV